MINIHDKKILQDGHAWVVDLKNSAQVSIQNVSVSDGGLLMVESDSADSEIVLKNVYNSASTYKYFVMLWPQSPDGKQIAVKKFIWDNSGISKPVLQGPNEAAFRGKCDDATIVGVKFKGFLKNGQPWKQVVQIRHGKSWVFQHCEFIDSFPDIGQQKTAQPDGSSHYETSQHVGVVIFDHCKFDRMPGDHTYVSRQPGVDKIEFINCQDSSGKVFTRTI